MSPAYWRTIVIYTNIQNAINETGRSAPVYEVFVMDTCERVWVCTDTEYSDVSLRKGYFANMRTIKLTKICD